MKLPHLLLACLGFLAMPFRSWGGDFPDFPQLTEDDVKLIIEQATTKASRINPDAVIAVSDREGFILAVWDAKGRLPRVLPPFDVTLNDEKNIRLYSLVAAAITRASTAAFLSSNQNAFTTRTAGFIIQQHFPPGVRNTGNGPLVGVGLSSLFYSDVNRVKMFPDGFDGAAIFPLPNVSPGVRADFFPLTSLNDSPGGVPLYKGGALVGGIGVTGDGSPSNLTPAGAFIFHQINRDSTFTFKTGKDRDEQVALAGQTGFRPRSGIQANNVLINGIRVPYVYERDEDIQDIDDPKPLGSIGHAIDYPLPSAAFTAVAPGRPRASPARYPYPINTLGGYKGEVRFPFRDDPLRNVPGRERIRGSKRLSADDVEDVIKRVAARAFRTRAGIRLPIGTPMKIFITVVGNPDRAGDIPPILGIFRTGEATVFSLDVSAQKARTALFFSNRQLAMSSRAVGWLAQRFYPPGLDGRDPGPLFGFQEAVSLRRNPQVPARFSVPLESIIPTLPAGLITVFRDNVFLPITVGGFNVGFPGNTNVNNGITIFPGGFPLYRGDQVIGAVGVSGDGVDQDDIAASSGTENFLPDPKIRSDHFSYRGARLPYVKFPRDPNR
jgi:uncharacterized protein GlcG (DUF336 family)